MDMFGFGIGTGFRFRSMWLCRLIATAFKAFGRKRLDQREGYDINEIPFNSGMTESRDTCTLFYILFSCARRQS